MVFSLRKTEINIKYWEIRMIDGKKPTTIVTVMLKVQHEDIPKDGTASSWVESQMGWLDLDGIQFVEVLDEIN